MTGPLMGSRPFRTGLLLSAATLLVYAPLLSYVPAYLAHDEVVFSLSAHAIATTAHDVQGRLFPLFFQITDRYWATPVAIYTTALRCDRSM